MDKLIDETIESFLEMLGSGEPVPGGGGAAALSSAMGAALLMMVANHTIGRPQYKDYEELNQEVLKAAGELRSVLMAGIDEDAEAFLRVMRAYRLPSESDEDKAEREEAVAEASEAAAGAPLRVMEASVEGLRLGSRLLGASNPMLRSDIVTAAHSFIAGIRSAACNVEANLPGIRRKNETLAEKFRQHCSDLLKEAEAVFTEING